MASLSLGFLSNFINHSLNWMSAIVSVPVVHAFVSHELADESSISSQAREHHSHVVIDIVDLLLVGG